MESMQALGRVADKTSTSKFRFIVDRKVKKWDYIKVKHPSESWVLAQVTEIEKSHDTIADSNIIGYRTERGFLRKPRTPLEPGADVLAADDSFIESTLGLMKKGIYLGLLEGKETLKAFIDPEKLITKHLAILAKSGAGKSYTIGVILEELANLGVPVIIIDPHGEYSSIKYSNEDPEDKKYFKLYDINPQGFREKVKEYALNTSLNPECEQLKLEIPGNPFDIVESLPFKITNAQKGLLYSAVTELKERKSKFDFQDIISILEMIDTNAKWSLINAIENLEKTNLFSIQPTTPLDLIRPNQLSIINLKGAPIELQQIAVHSLASNLFEQRKLNNIPPFFLIIEEAHNFLPERGFGEAKSSRILRTIASEGRKFGLGMAIVSQRPARADKNVLSQCTSQISLQVTNPNDLKAISTSFEGVTSETENEIRSLPTGKALVIGVSDYPIFVDVRVRKSKHGGRAETFNFNEEPIKSEVSQDATLDLIFKPRIAIKEVKNMEEKEIDSVGLVLSPCLVVHCESGSETAQLVFDLTSNSLYDLDDNLKKINLFSGLNNLSPMQKKVLVAISKKPKSTLSELFVETNLSFGEVTGVVDSLVARGVIELKDKEVYPLQTLNIFGNISKLNFLDKPEYISIEAQKVSQNIEEQTIINMLNDLSIKVTNKKQAYIPFYAINFKDNSKKIIDALTYSLEK